jgi:hypothetical protein
MIPAAGLGNKRTGAGGGNHRTRPGLRLRPWSMAGRCDKPPGPGRPDERKADNGQYLRAKGGQRSWITPWTPGNRYKRTVKPVLRWGPNGDATRFRLAIRDLRGANPTGPGPALPSAPERRPARLGPARPPGPLPARPERSSVPATVPARARPRIGGGVESAPAPAGGRSRIGAGPAP